MVDQKMTEHSKKYSTTKREFLFLVGQKYIIYSNPDLQVHVSDECEILKYIASITYNERGDAILRIPMSRSESTKAIVSFEAIEDILMPREMLFGMIVEQAYHRAERNFGEQIDGE